MAVTRFAPSPTGRLHLGHAYSAWFSYQAGTAEEWLVRLEDLDSSRCRPEYEDTILEDLVWLGLETQRPILRQSRRREAHQSALAVLSDLGVLYRCFCSRKEILVELESLSSAPHGPDGPIYPGTCRGLSEDEVNRRLDQDSPYCWRLNSKLAVEIAGPLNWTDDTYGFFEVRPEEFGDVMVARRDGAASYHLAVVVDDAFQGVELVTRGRDILRSTSIQVLLQKLLHLPTPNYRHHRLVVDHEGRRLAKRLEDRPLGSYRDDGLTPQQVIQLAHQMLETDDK